MAVGKLRKESGYAVYVRDAVSELEKTAPDAAAWWRKDAARLQAPGRKFVFQTPCCELVQFGYEPRGKSALSPAGVKPPAAGLSAVPQIPLHRARRPNSHTSPVVPAILLALVLFGWFWNRSHPIHPERQTTVHGNLVDWSLHTYSSRGGSQTTVHLRITGSSDEFHIDPALFRDLMRNRLPPGFVKGAAIDITADAAQLAAPIHPLLKPSIAVVWVNGLVVNGATALALEDVLQHERGQWTGWLALAAMAAVYLGYTIVNSRRQLATA